MSGSLAAINKWVEDMDTGGSSDEDEDDLVDTGGDFRGDAVDSGNYVGTSLSNMVSGETLASFAASGKGAGVSREENDASSHGSRSLNSNSNSNSTGRGNREILSRKKILSMVGVINVSILLII